MRQDRFLPVLAVGVLLSLCLAATGSAFEDRTPRVHALVGARVIPAPGVLLENATIVLRDGIIEAVGNVEPPADARIWDMQGMTVYAGLIEPFYNLDGGEKGKDKDDGDKKESSPEVGVRHANARVRAENRVVESRMLSEKELQSLRQLGFTTAHLVNTKGAFCGQSALVDLHDGVAAEQVVRADLAQIVRFEHAGWNDKAPTYPSSLMGAVALVRQTFLDASWAMDASARYASRSGGFEKPLSNLSWDALAPTLDKDNPKQVWLVTGDVLGSLRSAALAKELNLNAVLVGNGEEYQHASRLQTAGYPMVLPVAFPKAPDVSNEDALVRLELDVLQHWEQAPGNAARMHASHVVFALTSDGLDKRQQYHGNIHKAIEAGLPADAALAAVTTGPAQLLGVDTHYGTIAKGKVAQLTVTNGDLFAEDTKVLEVWVHGDRYEIADEKRDDIAQVQGIWRVVAGEEEAPTSEWTLEIKGNEWTLRGSLVGTQGDVELKKLQWQRGELLLTTNHGETLLLEPAAKKELAGTWRQADGTEVKLAATRLDKDKDKDKDKDTEGGAK